MPKQPKKRKAVPLIFPKAATTAAEKFYQAGEGERQEASAVPPEGGWDSSYVPQFSDHKHMNEILKSMGKEQVALPANLCWVPQGYRGFMPWEKKGYTVITDAVEVDGERKSKTLEQFGWGFPPAATVTPDGRIRKDDAYLAYVGKDRYDHEVAKDLEDRRFRESGGGAEHIDMTTEESRKIRLSDDDIA